MGWDERSSECDVYSALFDESGKTVANKLDE